MAIQSRRALYVPLDRHALALLGLAMAAWINLKSSRSSRDSWSRPIRFWVFLDGPCFAAKVPL